MRATTQGSPAWWTLRQSKESFDDNYGLAVIHGPVQIEEDQRFPEPGRKTISRFGLANRSSGVSDKAAILIVNGYHDAPACRVSDYITPGVRI